MGISLKTVKICAVSLALLAITACTNIDRKHGYVPSEEDLAEIVVGVDTKDTVADLVGRPTTQGLLAGSGWFYVKSKFRTYGIRQNQEIDREVVSITFDENDVVTNIEHFGLEDGQVVAFSRRVTDSNIKGISILRQLFGNVGRISTDRLFNQ